MTSTRGKWAGKAPRLRFGGLPADGLVFALAAASSAGHLLGHGLFQVLGRLLHRLVGQLLRSPAEAIALQAGKLKPQPLDLGQRRAQDRLQRRGIVGQVCGRFEHAGRLNCRCELGPMNLA